MNNQWILMIEGYPIFGQTVTNPSDAIRYINSPVCPEQLTGWWFPKVSNILLISVYLCFYHCRSMFISLIIPKTGLISNDFPNFLEPRFRLMQPRHAEVNMPAMPTRFLSWNKSPRCSPATCTCDGNWVAKGFSQCLRWVGVKLLGHWIYHDIPRMTRHRKESIFDYQYGRVLYIIPIHGTSIEANRGTHIVLLTLAMVHMCSHLVSSPFFPFLPIMII